MNIFLSLRDTLGEKMAWCQKISKRGKDMKKSLKMCAGVLSALFLVMVAFAGCSSSVDGLFAADATGEDPKNSEQTVTTDPTQPTVVNPNEDGELEDIPDSVDGLKPFTALNISDMSNKTYTADEVEAKDNVKIVSPSEKGVAVEKKSATVDKTKYTKRLKLGGAGKERSVVIYVGANVEGVLRVVCVSSNSSASDRALMANDVKLGNAPAKNPAALSASVKGDENGYIAIYSGNGGGINLYYIAFTSGAASSGSEGVEKQCSSEASTPALDNSTLRPSYDNGLKVGSRTKINEIDTSKIAKVVYAAPDGKTTGDGSRENPLDLAGAVLQVEQGGAVVLLGGKYSLSSTVKIAVDNNGSPSAYKYMLPESGAAVVLDFSTQEIGDSNRGIQMDGSYWHIYGITVYNAGDNGMIVTGKHNIIERCLFQANQDTGLQIARRASSVSNFDEWPSDNLILNCTSFDNKDDKTGENADGFASKLTCGNGNVFDGCISYANCDDGWDMYAKPATGSIGIVTLKNCVAFSNGKTTSGANYANGDMNGFKLGGSNNACPTPHVVTNCMAFLNGKDGFTDNGNGGALDVLNCTSYANVNSNFNFYRTLAGGVFKKLVSMIGSASITQIDKFGGKASEVTVAAKISDSIYLTDKKKGTFNYVFAESEIHNGDKIGETVSDLYKTDVNAGNPPAIDLLVDAKCRNADGTVNMGGYLETKDSSKYASLGAHFGSEAYEVLDLTLQMN